MGIFYSEKKVEKEQIKLNCNFKKIKSKNILKKLFNNIETKRKLNLIKYNNYIIAY